MVDTEGRSLYVNDTYLEMLELSAEDNVAKRSDKVSWQDHIHEEDIDNVLEIWGQLKTHKVPVTIEYRLKRPWMSTDKSGQEMSGETWLLATAFPEIGADWYNYAAGQGRQVALNNRCGANQSDFVTPEYARFGSPLVSDSDTTYVWCQYSCFELYIVPKVGEQCRHGPLQLWL